MKTVFLQLLTTLLILTIYSCSKTNIEAGLLVGNWNVVNDSSFNTNKFYTLSLVDSGISNSNYVGEQCGATFNFNSNGNMVTSFYNCTYGWPSVDSAKYVLASDQITISIFAQNAGCCSFTHLNPVVTRTYAISNLTVNTATLIFSIPYGSRLASGTEIINLKR
ncbi:MAG TPA: hypothetical protein VIJ95_07090 [Hanamia sp.]